MWQVTFAVLILSSSLIVKSDQQQCDNSVKIEGCLTSMITNPTVMAALSAFQSLTPMSVATDTTEEFTNRMTLASGLCASLNATKYCAGKNLAAVAWWQCPVLFQKVMFILQFLKSAMQNAPDLQADTVKRMLELANDMCFSPLGIPALSRNQPCLQAALLKPELSDDVDDFTTLFSKDYTFTMPGSCNLLQSGIGKFVPSISTSCASNLVEALAVTQAVFKAAVKFVNGYNESTCPIFTAPATTTTTSTTTTTTTTTKSTTTTTTTTTTTMTTTTTTVKAGSPLLAAIVGSSSTTTTKSAAPASTTSTPTTTTTAPSSFNYDDGCRYVNDKLVC